MTRDHVAAAITGWATGKNVRMPRSHQKMMNGRLYAALLAASLLAGCSGIKTYPDTLPKNLRIHTAISKVQAALHIHRVDASCQAEYQGTVQLDESSVEVGLSAERFSYVVFSFTSSSFLTGSSTSVSYETLLRPRAGYTYDVKASYQDNIYSVTVREIDPRRSSSREIERRDLRTCRAA